MAGVAIIFTLFCKSLFSSAEQALLVHKEQKRLFPAASACPEVILGFPFHASWEKGQFKEHLGEKFL